MSDFEDENRFSQAVVSSEIWVERRVLSQVDDDR